MSGFTKEHGAALTSERENAIIIRGIGKPKWACGHPLTAENTQPVGKAGVRCKICRRRITARWEAARRARAKSNSPEQGEG